MEAKRRSKKIGNTISELPPEIFYLILSKIPFLNLLACKQVCKAWNTLISSCKSSDSNLFIAQIYTVNGRMLQIVDLDSKHSKGMNVVASLNLNRKWSKIETVNSCNGLLLCTLNGGRTAILNPMTNEFTEVPRGRRDGKYVYGLGFSPKTKQYKIVRHSFKNHQPLIEIFALGSTISQWTRVVVGPFASDEESFQMKLTHQMKLNGVCWNGGIYWFGCHLQVFPPQGRNGMRSLNEVRNGMWRLNVEDEKFEEICCPSFGVVDGCSVHYGVVNGSLYLTHYTQKEFEYHVWKMDGEEGLWIREFVVANPTRPKPSDPFQPILAYDMQLIKFYGDGKILFLVHGVYLVLYDPKTGEVEKLDHHQGMKPLLRTWKINSFHFDSLHNILAT